MKPKQFDWRKHLKVHPAAELFPPMSEAELQELAEDIKANGLQTRIVFWDQGGQEPELLDGRNRLDALAILGLLCIDADGQLALTKKWQLDDKAWIDDDSIPHLRLGRQY